MDLWLALLVFALSTADDILVVFYLHRVVDGDIVRGILFSMAIGVIQLIGINYFIESRWYGVLLIAGNGVGTGFAIWYEKRFPAKKPRDKKTGKFKPPVSPANFQLGNKI